MAWSILSGQLRPQDSSSYDPSLSQFPFNAVKQSVNSYPNMFCGLVGMPGIGKTTVLHHFGSDGNTTNVLYLRITGGIPTDLDDIIYDTLASSIITPPRLLSEIRFSTAKSNRDIVSNVFKLVKRITGESVCLVIDITMEKEPDVGILDATHSTGATLDLVAFQPRQFVQQCRRYVADMGLARVLFAAPDSESFQELACHEPRLSLYCAEEVPLASARSYLEHLRNNTHGPHDASTRKNSGPGRPDVEVIEKHLQLFPRTFVHLHRYHLADDKEAYVRTCTEAEENKIRASFYLPSPFRIPYLSELRIAWLYQLALRRPINAADIGFYGLTKLQFQAFFLKTDIFRQTDKGTYVLRCDSTRAAVNAVLRGKSWWQL